MNLKIVLAGAASALLVGSFAVAQTTPAPSDTTAPSSSMPSSTTTDQSTTGAATSADQYSTDTAAQSADTTQAGERG